ncbi:TolC family protein [Gemmatimonas sp.]
MSACLTGDPSRARHWRLVSAVPVPLLAAAFSLVPSAAVSGQPRASGLAFAGATPRVTTTVVQPPLDSLAPARVLARLQEAAEAASPALAARRADLEAARARQRASGFAAPLLLSAGASETPSGNFGQGNVRLEVGRAIFTGSRLRAERAVAAVDVSAAEVALVVAVRRVRAAALREAVRAAGAEVVARRLASEDALLAGGEEGVRARFAVGEARYVDVLRLRTERLRVQSERAAALAEARAAVATLGGLLGAGETSTASAGLVRAALDSLATPALAESWRHVLPADAVTDSLITAAVAASSEVQLATAAVSRAEAERALALAARRPQVEALGGLQRIGQANNGPAFGPSFGVTVSLPFTAGQANRFSGAAFEQAIVAAGAEREATRVAVRARTRAAAEHYAAARERLAVFDVALLRGARDERESALASYRAGGLSLIELVDFERALARAEIDRVRALTDAVNAWVDLSVGGATQDDPTLFPASTGDSPRGR